MLGAAVGLPIFAAIFGFTYVVKPVYSATAELKIAVPASKTPGAAAYGLSEVDTEIGVIGSRKVAAAVAKRMKFYDRPEFVSPNLRTGASMEERIDAAIDPLLANLSVSREGDTSIVRVGYTFWHSGEVATIANVFVEEYLATTLQMRQERAAAQAASLTPIISKLEQEASDASKSAADFRANLNLVNAAGGATITQQQASTAASQLSVAEADLAKARAEIKAAEYQVKEGQADAVNRVLDSPVIQSLRRQRAEVLRDQVELSNRYGPLHPSYVRGQNQLATIDRQLSEETDRLLTALKAAVAANETRVATLRASLVELEGKLKSASRAEAEAVRLDKEAATKQQMVAQYRTGGQEVAEDRVSRLPQATILSRATPPLAVTFPNKRLFLLLGLASGAIVALVAMLTAEMLESRLLDGEDVEEELQQRFVTSLPMLPNKSLRRGKQAITPADFVVDRPMSSYAEALRSLRGSLASQGGRGQIVAITSALPGEGKSVASLAFARVLGMGGARVVVVDCDLRRSTLRSLARPSNPLGLVEFLSGTAELADCISEDVAPNVTLLPLSGAHFTPEDVFGGNRFDVLLNELRAAYDLVILDTPPVLAVADARVVATASDKVLFLCRWSRTPKAAARAALVLLLQDGANVVGVALNMVGTKRARSLSTTDAPYYREAYSAYYDNK